MLIASLNFPSNVLREESRQVLVENKGSSAHYIAGKVKTASPIIEVEKSLFSKFHYTFQSIFPILSPMMRVVRGGCIVRANILGLLILQRLETLLQVCDGYVEWYHHIELWTVVKYKVWRQ